MRTATDCLAEGFRLARQPGLRRWVILPLAANTLLFGFAIWWVWGMAAELLAGLAGFAAGGGWVGWLVEVLAGLLQLVVLALLLVGAAWVFSGVLHLLTAPFNGLLAEQAWERYTGRQVPDIPFRQMVGRTLRRTLQAFRYWAVRALGLALLSLLLGWLPLVNTLVPLAWFLFGAWMTAITFLDYPADNLGVSFEDMLARLHAQRREVLVLGAAVFGLLLVPVVNFVMLPVAVCAATVMWAERFADDAGTARPPR